jgi:hypothetical protein
VSNIFVPWPKTQRWFEKNTCTITEKLDGTNACVAIDEAGNIWAQSRNRIITPEDDNHGFAKWVQDNKEDLLRMGHGHHFGEWVGPGIQRGYSDKVKRFFLFNSKRWLDEASRTPTCCSVVPVLATLDGTLGEIEEAVQYALRKLENEGSVAFPNFMRPEGVCVYHHRLRQVFKAYCNGEG